MPALSSRVRPPQVLLAVGAVLLVAGAVATGGATGGLLLGALAAGTASAWASRRDLSGTRETLAAVAVALAVAGVADGGPFPGSPAGPAVLALVLVGVARLQPGPLTWPLGAWAVVQLAAVRAAADVPAGVLRTCVLLTLALGGLAVVLGARTTLAKIALVTTVPWWVLGVAGGTGAAWSAGVGAGISAALTVVAAAGLLVVRLEPSVSPLLGPPRAIPVLAGGVAGAAVAGALSGSPASAVLAGYTGVLLAAGAAALLDGWRRGLLLPAALAAGAVLLASALVQLLVDTAWAELALLLVLTALPAVLVARWRREDRPAALPAAVGCLAAAAALAVPAGMLRPEGAAVVLSVLYAVALAGAAGLAAGTRGRTTGTGAVAAVAALGFAAATGSPSRLAAHLAAQGLLTWLWAVQVHRRVTGAGGPARTAGAAQLVLAAWVLAASAGTGAVEAYTLPAAAGLLLAAGPRLRSGPSQPAWAPGLLVAAVPSVVLAVAAPGVLRPLLVLAAAAGVMVGGAAAGVRTPLLVGAGTAVALAVGLAVTALPLPLAGALVVGTALLALGARRELRPVGGFAERVADMR
ncbi:SCO7613 C-terminal domain-containing membrane protein [Blastococcus sp. URHD0036]|uniref:SCO7613 C-terminal domain-containing membrane protein n=1 Tax=Blastococcus sp. URHD0036 TaxID=1380356 RepID=UPI0012DEB2E5|nr:hypothetical protein [Blastococcus sp. URHD0036]